MTIAAGQIARNAGLLLAIIGFMYAAVCWVLYAMQRSMIYYPQPGAAESPDSTLTIPVHGATLRVSVRAHASPKALIYFGGNAEDVSLSLPDFSSAFPDRALFLLHYRGYGGSSGNPSEEAIHNDALALFDRVHLDYSDIAVIGRSLGSGVAIRLAGHRPVSSLVLVTAYDSIQELAARRFPYLPIRWLLTDKFESWRYAPAIRAPTLLLAAANDEVIPRSSTGRLYGAFSPGVASLKFIPETAHNTISNSALYLEEIRTALATP
ncbi:MAG TPA: alpha/beta fold hydrolase [Steroidobacteraceae bacterium]|nr:alpha/beta fold hydrolase [Steroidobacteraceae bacterium]